ncbi:hypothetical protein FACS189499_07230 [Clostridia bacterium]|nr:hypothetical protein FACS189499_07230 [Clostridia bacterium]
MNQLTINKNDSGQRLDRFLAKAFPELTNGVIRSGLRRNKIKLNGKVPAADVMLREGDSLKLYFPDFRDSRDSRPDSGKVSGVPRSGNAGELNIVFEDENILVIDKPPGLLCHAGNPDSRGFQDTLTARIIAYLTGKGEYLPEEEMSFTPALCNRIDRNTSGLVLAAKNAEALRILTEKIRRREVTKTYRCLVKGVPARKHAVLTAYHFKDAKENRVYISDKPGKHTKEIITEYRVVSEEKRSKPGGVKERDSSKPGGVQGCDSSKPGGVQGCDSSKPGGVQGCDSSKPGGVKASDSSKPGGVQGSDSIKCTELEITLHTGRTHQIRAHMAHIGHPLIGDGKYCKLEQIDSDLGWKSQALVSCKVSFDWTTPAGRLEYLRGKSISLKEDDLFRKR